MSAFIAVLVIALFIGLWCQTAFGWRAAAFFVLWSLFTPPRPAALDLLLFGVALVMCELTYRMLRNKRPQQNKG